MLLVNTYIREINNLSLMENPSDDNIKLAIKSLKDEFSIHRYMHCIDDKLKSQVRYLLKKGTDSAPTKLIGEGYSFDSVCKNIITTYFHTLFLDFSSNNETINPAWKKVSLHFFLNETLDNILGF